MTAPVQGLSATLCDLSPDHVGLARAAQQRLSAAGFEVTIATRQGGSGRWYLSENLAFEPLRDPPDRGAPAEELVRILDAQEDILSEIEAALGVAAEFSDHGELERDWPVLTVARDGERLCRIAVMTPVELPSGESSPDAPVLSQLGFVAARLPISDAEALEGGDMVVLSHGPWPLADGTGPLGAAAIPGAPPLGFDPHDGTLRPLLSDPAPASHGASDFMSSSDQTRQLSVPVTIHLADIAVTQADLERMAQSGTFDLGAVSEGLSARLSVGGRSIGSGEIVRLGDRFAVLLDNSEAPGHAADTVSSRSEEEPLA